MPLGDFQSERKLWACGKQSGKLFDQLSQNNNYIGIDWNYKFIATYKTNKQNHIINRNLFVKLTNF